MFILFFYNRFQIQCSTAPTITSKATISTKSLFNDVGAFRLLWFEIPVINLLATMSYLSCFDGLQLANIQIYNNKLSPIRGEFIYFSPNDSRI